RRMPLVVAALVLAAAAFLLLIATPPHFQARCLQFTLIQRPSNTTSALSYSVAVSNSSDSPVLYAGGFNKIWLTIAYSTNGVWQEARIRTPGGGNGVLPPHSEIKD